MGNGVTTIGQVLGRTALAGLKSMLGDSGVAAGAGKRIRREAVPGAGARVLLAGGIIHVGFAPGRSC